MPREDCRITHPQIRAGRCPHCQTFVADGASVEGQDSRPTMTSWNADAMRSDLASDQVEVRQATAMNLRWADFPLRTLWPLMALAVADDDREVQACGLNLLSHVAITAEDLPWLEERVSSASDELAARALLLAYYFHPRQESAAWTAARRTHICHVIERFPASSLAGSPHCLLLRHDDQAGYQQAKLLWDQACEKHADCVEVLGNAAQFFLLSDWRRAESLLRQAQSMEADNPEWHNRLARLYQLRSHARRDGDSSSFAAKAYTALREAERLGAADVWQPTDPATKALHRIYALPELARGAFAAGDLAAARSYADELLALIESDAIPEFFRREGNAIHYGHLVLGRLALQAGDVEGAKAHLLASAQSTGSPNLNSFGPNMSLAKELLECGERAAVLRYFELCGQFWNCGQDLLSDWKGEVEDGRIPEFGANLVY